VIVLIATVLSFIVVFLLQDNGELTKSRSKLIAAISLLAASAILYCMEFGTLRGVFVLVGALTLLGTLFTLLRYKLVKT
tara:strand:+ start:1055 stop:1291 length:237 start_codon:yes stop_codon:yes gene_type:complete